MKRFQIFLTALSCFVLFSAFTSDTTTGNDLDGKVFVIQSKGGKADGRVLDADGKTQGRNGTTVHLFEGVNNYVNQKWQFIASDKGPDLYYIISVAPNVGTHKYLDASFRDMGQNGGLVQLWEDNGGTDNQLWKVTKNQDGFYAIACAHPDAQGRVLDADGYTQHKDGGIIHLWQSLGNLNQQWNLIEIK